MKKIIILAILVLLIAPVFAQNYVPEVPVFMPTRYTAIGGYHVTDTTEYFTMFANPAGIHATEAEAVKSAFDVRISNPEVGSELGKLIYSAVTGDDMENATQTLTENLTGLLGENGLNVGFEIMGPLMVGSISNFEHGAFGWGLFSKTRYFAIIPTITQMDALAGFDNMLQFTYAAPIINNDVHYLSTGLSAKGLFMIEAGLSDVDPVGLLTNTTDIANVLPIYGHYGLSFDAGLYYSFLDFVNAGLVWRDLFNIIWTKEFNINTISDNFSTMDLPSSTSGSDSSSLDIGIGVDVPVLFLEAIITNFDVMLDYKDLVSLFNAKTVGRNPVLNLSFGTEITLIDFVSLRVGMSEAYLNAGVGLRLGKTNLEFSMYGRELGLEPGSLPQLNASFAISRYY